jgi:hypothetical protein
MSPAATGARRSAAGPRKRTTARPAARRRRRSTGLRGVAPALWWTAGLVALLIVGLAWKADAEDPAQPPAPVACALPASGVSLTDEQIGNARTIAQVTRDRGLPERAVVVALATAMQESALRNLDHGDRDSLGLFQQRPSQGWGTPEQVQDPVYATGAFLDHLVLVPDWQTMRVTDAAQTVQRSGFPEAYQKHAEMAVELATLLASPGSSCG